MGQKKIKDDIHKEVRKVCSQNHKHRLSINLDLTNFHQADLLEILESYYFACLVLVVVVFIVLVVLVVFVVFNVMDVFVILVAFLVFVVIVFVVVVFVVVVFVLSGLVDRRKVDQWTGQNFYLIS